MRSENLPRIKEPNPLMLQLHGVTHPLVIYSLNQWHLTSLKLKQYSKHEKHCETRILIRTYSVGSEADEDELMSESEDSNDSWTTSEEFSAEFILRYGGR